MLQLGEFCTINASGYLQQEAGSSLNIRLRLCLDEMFCFWRILTMNSINFQRNMSSFPPVHHDSLTQMQTAGI